MRGELPNARKTLTISLRHTLTYRAANLSSAAPVKENLSIFFPIRSRRIPSLSICSRSLSPSFPIFVSLCSSSLYNFLPAAVRAQWNAERAREAANAAVVHGNALSLSAFSADIKRPRANRGRKEGEERRSDADRIGAALRRLKGCPHLRLSIRLPAELPVAHVQDYVLCCD